MTNLKTIFCECCNKSYNENYYKYFHIKNKKHIKKDIEYKQNENVEKIEKIESNFEKKLSMLNDINNLFRKYGEEKILKELDIKEKIVEVIKERKVLKIVYKSKKEDIELIRELREQVKELKKENEIIENIDITDMIEEVVILKKKCNKCGEEKVVGDFYNHKREKDGLRRTCKKCEKKRNKQLLKNIIIEDIKREEELKMKKLEEDKLKNKIFCEKKVKFIDIVNKQTKEVVKEKSWIDIRESNNKLKKLEEERYEVLKKRTNDFYECKNTYDKGIIIKGFGEQLDKLDIDINELYRIKNNVYEYENGENELERQIRIMGVIIKERDLFLSGKKISWDKRRVENRYMIELNNYKERIDKLVGCKGDWLKDI